MHRLAKYFLRTERRSFTIPPLELSLQGQDMIGEPCTVSERLYGAAYALTAVEEEVAASATLRPDCRAQVMEPEETLWVEFFYTNAKKPHDVEKIRQQKLSCLEIDISGLTFNSSPEEIIRAVFTTANRKWLNHARHDELQAALPAKLEQAISDRNRSLIERATSFMNYLTSPPVPLPDALIWETIQVRSGQSSVAKTPQLQSISPAWQRNGIYWQSQATISGEKQVQCSVIFQMRAGEGARTLPSFQGRPTTPTLLIEADVKASHARRTGYTLSWHNIDRWRDKLQRQARANEAVRLAGIKDYNDWFLQLDPREKVQEALGTLGLQPDPKYPRGKYSPPWKAYALTWKCLVIKHFMLHELLPVTISTAEIANAAIFYNLLGFDQDEASLNSRRIKLYMWLKALADNNYLQNEGRQHFRVTRLPRKIGELIEVDEDVEAARSTKKVEVKAQVYCPRCHGKIITKSNAQVSLLCPHCGQDFKTHT